MEEGQRAVTRSMTLLPKTETVTESSHRHSPTRLLRPDSQPSPAGQEDDRDVSILAYAQHSLQAYLSNGNAATVFPPGAPPKETP